MNSFDFSAIEVYWEEVSGRSLNKTLWYHACTHTGRIKQAGEDSKEIQLYRQVFSKLRLYAVNWSVCWVSSSRCSAVYMHCQSGSNPDWENSSWPDLCASLHHVSANQLRVHNLIHASLSSFFLRLGARRLSPRSVSCPSPPLPQHDGTTSVRRTAFASKLDGTAWRRPGGPVGNAAADGPLRRPAASMGGSAIDGLIFADFRATNPLVVQISQLFRPSRLSPTWSPADSAHAHSLSLKTNQ